jgi:hypothetical protein
VGRGSKALEELPGSLVAELEPELLGETVEEGRLEVDDRDKVIGTFPRASGSRPTFLAAVTLKLSAFCAKLATTFGRGAGTTHCDVDEGPSGNSRYA